MLIMMKVTLASRIEPKKSLLSRYVMLKILTYIKELYGLLSAGPLCILSSKYSQPYEQLLILGHAQQ